MLSKMTSIVVGSMKQISSSAFLNSNVLCYPTLHTTHRDTYDGQSGGVTRHHPRNVRNLTTVKCRQARTPVMQVSGSSSVSLSNLKSRLFTALQGLDFGLTIDADAETMTEQEGEAEELIEELENRNECDVPSRDDRMNGKWQLLYMNSTISRYSGGVTGLHRYFPDSGVKRIEQNIDIEDGAMTMSEIIEFDVPFVDKRASVTATITGKLRANSEIRQTWDAEKVRIFFLSWFADGWKTVRAFKIADITYLDHDLRITRGQTGSVCVFTKAPQ